MLLSSVWAEDCSRIVSIAPSVTELLYALELGDNLVGVTRYCNFPDQAKTKEKVGGFLDLNLEKVISLKPTVVIGLAEQKESLAALKSLGKETILISHASVTGILQSIKQIGRSCEKETISDRLFHTHSATISKIRNMVEELLLNHPRPRVLICVGRGDGDDLTQGIYASGSDGYYSEILNILGAENINTETTAAFPILSAEGVISKNPDVIIEIVAPEVKERLSEEDLKRIWGKFRTISAVKSGRIHLLAEDFMSVPGPRFPLVLSKFLEILWKEKI